MKTVIIAGGRGKRLGSITDTMPKPMVDVQRKPILEHIVNLCKTYAITEFIFLLCYLPQKITSYFGNGSKFGVHIEYVYEEENKPLGTAGGLHLVRKHLNNTFIVSYADILRDLDITEMVRLHKAKKAFATLNVYKRNSADAKSMVVFDNQNRISQFVERPKSDMITQDFVWSNGSFYLFEPGVFEFIPQEIASDFGKEVFPKIIESGKPMYAYPSAGYFIDIGNQEKLEKARKTFNQNQ